MTDLEKLRPPTDAPAPAAADDKLDKSVWMIAGVIVLGAIMSILDMTVVNVALPTFQGEFHVTPAMSAWTMTGYTLALASVIPVTGWAADRFGTKRLYVTALVLFVAGSVLCSTAWNIESLIGFRVLQGLGGGMLMPLGMTIMTRAAGPQRVGQVMAVLGVPMLLGPIGGPILGGWLIESVSWHWIFLINVPIGAVALAAAVLILPRDAAHKSEKFDFLGLLLLSPGLALFLFGVSSIPEKQAVLASRVLVPAIIGVALIIAFVFHALRTASALIDLHLFKNRNLTVAVITSLLFSISFFGAALLLPSYFLQVRGESTLNAGLLLIPQGLGAMLTMPVAGKLVDKIGPGKIVLTGLVLIVVGMLSFTQLGTDTSYVVLLGSLFVMGLGMGATMMPIMTAALATLTDHQIARGSSLMNIINQVGASTGTAIISVLLTNNLQSREFAQVAIGSQFNPEIAKQLPPGALDLGLTNAAHAFGACFVVSIALIVVTLVPAFLLPRTPAKAPVDSNGEVPVIMH